VALAAPVALVATVALVAKVGKYAVQSDRPSWPGLARSGAGSEFPRAARDMARPARAAELTSAANDPADGVNAAA
jgi:hypothetical protein